MRQTESEVRQMFPNWHLRTVKIRGYRPFRDFAASLGLLEIMVGANGSGKSSLFEFLKFLRDSTYQDIPPEIIAGSIGQQIFHTPGPERFQWEIEIDVERPTSLTYEGELTGPIGRTEVSYERVRSTEPYDDRHTAPHIFMDMKGRRGVVKNRETRKLEPVPDQELVLNRPNQLALSVMTDPRLDTLNTLREYVLNWRFYSSFRIANDLIRNPTPIEQEPNLHEDARNLSAVLFYLMTEHREAFDELQHHLRLCVPGFKGLTVKARGRGQAIAFWQEGGVDLELSLADLSDGILRLICWMCLCVHPHPPSLICIDEPDQGVHPRTLPILAGLFEKACDRTQLLLATHSSYFLTQFDIARIAVLRKENGEAKFIKPKDSGALLASLQEFGADEIELMHRNDELEALI